MASGMEYRVTVNNVDLVKSLLEQVEEKILEEWGILAEGYAVEACPVDTGNLRNSISHKASPSEHLVEYGTNVEYGVFVEYGTGIYAEEGKGRKTPWFYVDEKGVGHFTHGSKPQPFIRPALTEHTEEYKDILWENCTNA